jgi:hypothetical protein
MPMAVELAAMGFYLPISVDTESLKPNFGPILPEK